MSNSVRPLARSAVVSNFDGVNLGLTACGCQPPDVNAAVGVKEITEMVNLRLEVYTKIGAALCGVGLNALLGTSDSLSDPRVMYDNVNNRYLFVFTLLPASGTATPAFWVGATHTGNPCGGWRIFRTTVSGVSFPAGTLLDYPILGQDRNAMLLSTSNFTPSAGENFTVFGIPKSVLYTGDGFSFTVFNTASQTAPATISSTFAAPPRRVNQPGTTVTLDPLNGRIDRSPVNDGNLLWFAHGIGIDGFPGVRYGAISLAANTATVAMAYRSSTSDDFNPSAGLGISPTSGDFIYINCGPAPTPRRSSRLRHRRLGRARHRSARPDRHRHGPGQRNEHHGDPLRRLLLGGHRADQGRRQLRGGSAAVLRRHGTRSTRIARLGTC